MNKKRRGERGKRKTKRKLILEREEKREAEEGRGEEKIIE